MNANLLTSGRDVRQACRSGRLRQPTPGLALGYVQANLVILPQEYAADFQRFCELNPGPCPLIEMTAPGQFEPRQSAPGADLRTDLPGYRLWENGQLKAELDDIRNLWQNDSVAFLIGCSFTFENALIREGLSIRHIDQGVNVPMYRTNIPCESAGVFSGQMVVSMRPFPPYDVPQAIEITKRFPRAHGAPKHVGDPGRIGITNLNQPDFGDPVALRADEVPVFWACGVTPQVALMNAKLPLAITHRPGYMFVTDLKDSDFEE